VPQPSGNETPFKTLTAMDLRRHAPDVGILASRYRADLLYHDRAPPADPFARGETRSPVTGSRDVDGAGSGGPGIPASSGKELLR
jgi:hypothetical protein